MGVSSHEVTKSWWIERMFVQRAWIVWSVFWIISITATLALVLSGGFVFSENNTRDFMIRKDIRVQTWDAVEAAKKELTALLEVNVSPQTVLENKHTTLTIFGKKGQQLLTPENLKMMYAVDQRLKNGPNYDKLCFINKEFGLSDCSLAYLSFLKLFNFSNPEMITQSVIDATFELAKSVDPFFPTYFDKRAYSIQNFTTGDVTFVRSTFLYGAPYPSDEAGRPYASPHDRSDEQSVLFETYIDEFIEDVAYRSESDSMNVYIGGVVAIDYLFNQSVAADFLWATASFVFVFLCCLVHMKSIFMSATGMFMIVISFPLTYIIYRYVFQITFFQTIHVLTVFVVLGIGADDLFVMLDAWRQAPVINPELSSPEKMIERMSYTYRRGARATLATSATTFVAFVSTGTSSIMPISSFGYFAAMLVMMNWILVCVIFPPTIVIHEKYFYSTVSSRCRNERNTTVISQGYLEKFFETKFAPFVCKFRLTILPLFCLLFGLMTWRALSIKPLSSQEQWFPENHVITKTRRLLENTFPTGSSDSRAHIRFVWGLLGIDRKKSSSWDSDDFGRAMFDPDFNLSSEAGQMFFIEACDLIRTYDDVFVDERGVHDVRCFMEPFRQWVNENNSTLGTKFPVPPSRFHEILKQWTQDLSSSGPDFERRRLIAFSGSELKLAMIETSTSAFTPTDPYASLFPQWNKWEARKDSINRQAPVGMKNVLQEGDLLWTWMVTQKAFIQNALSGMVTSVVVCFIILVFLTGNIYVSLLCVLSVLGVLACVIGVIELLGYELGTAESITTVILIGLSVDYTVHLANHFVESPAQTRTARTTEALRDMGVSMISSGATTIGSSLFLWGAAIIFFKKFALFMTLTTIFSWLWAFFFFSALLFAIGPEGTFGDMKHYFKAIASCCLTKILRK